MSDGTTVVIWVVVALVALIAAKAVLNRERNRRTQEQYTAGWKRDAETKAIRQQAMARNPPIWPPRKPDDWGLEEENAYKVAQAHHQQQVAFATAAGHLPPSPPTPPMHKSWEAHNRINQDQYELQIRWAQNDVGQWVAVEWGNKSRRPADGGPLPVYQSMKRADNGEWIWVRLGKGEVDPSWQNGPQMMVEFPCVMADGTNFICLRPVGVPGGRKAPPPMKPDRGRGSSDWKGGDDLAALGGVRRK